MRNKTKTLYRKATVSSADAFSQLSKRREVAEVISFETKTASAAEARLANANVGDDVFVATVRLAEFPPKDEGSDESEAPEPKEEAPEAPDESDSEDSPEDPIDDGAGEDGAPDFGDKAKKPPVEEQILHTLQAILHALEGGAGPDDGLGDPGLGGDLPDVGAPPAGGGLPPSKDSAPLPPPVPQKSPMGGGAFASKIAGREDFIATRKDSSHVGTRTLIAEAHANFPGFRVSKVDRRSKADEGIALLKLVKRQHA